MGFFALGTIDPLLVDRFDGFDLPGRAKSISILPDGTGATTDEVIQSAGTPFRRATITGTITEADDLGAFREYDELMTPITFRDGNGNEDVVMVLELHTSDRTELWTFSATLILSDEPSGS